MESLRIEEGAKVPEESLNQKSEWTMLKLPHIQLRRVKGSQLTKKEEKRIRYENLEGIIEGEKGNEEEKEN